MSVLVDDSVEWTRQVLGRGIPSIAHGDVAIVHNLPSERLFG